MAYEALDNPKEDRQCTYKRNIEARSRNHCCGTKTISITYFRCVCLAFVAQHERRMRRITLPLWPVRLYNIFAHYLIKATNLKKK
jgi:hypothetical protein